ncbi:MAG: hypothetical protein IJ633_07250 [Prevotella sp.]|nr:hypothetical protein [Prevotella sp.]
MKKNLLTSLLLAVSLSAFATDYDLNEPFGFCTVSSRTDATSTYNITGGGCYTYPVPDGFTGKVITLKSNGQDMKSTIQNAIKNYDVVILDGTDGDFIVSESIGFERGGKTIIGINNARLCTKWYVTDEIKAALDEAGVPGMSTSGGGGKLPNGTNVSEEAEYNTRRIIIEMTGDNNESYRKSGIFSLNKENVIIRNITFVGPGSIDVGGYDLISATGAKHCWIDHCVFMDGMDGNFDITQSADFNTVSWCIFRYTSRSYMHQNTNLIGSSDSEAKGYLNTTFAFNWWSTGCKQRMPMGRVGKIHMLNNYYSCSGASLCMNPRINSEFLVEGNNFATGVKNYYRSNDATAVTWADNNIVKEASTQPSSFGTTVTVPYTYTVAPATDVPDAVQNGAGATLPYGENSGSEETTGKTGSILWAMSSNTDAEVSSAINDFITSTTMTLGSELELDGTQNISGVGTETKIKQKNVNATSATNDNAITFTLTTKSGFKFKATELSFYATRMGTDRGKLDVKWVDGNGELPLANGVTPARNNASTPYTTYTYNVENESKATEGTCSLVINIYELSFNNGDDNFKDIGFANILIKGSITDATGITTPVIVKGDGNIYNLRGQRVTESYKGIVIKNGKKMIQK